MPDAKNALPSSLNAALLLADGTIFFGQSIGAHTSAFGEICFNTAMTGYQEVMTDPSYRGQIITFTFPHIGNVGCNAEDIESIERKPLLGASGMVVREPITSPSNFRAVEHLHDWLVRRGVAGICGVDTRALTRHIRKKGSQNAAIIGLTAGKDKAQIKAALATLKDMPSMKGKELAKEASVKAPYTWEQPRWSLEGKPSKGTQKYHVVAIDYGEKLNILRCLVSVGCKVTVVPANTSADVILALKPDGVFLSNGPGDPAATGQYSVPVIRGLIDAGLPVFGICLGHQMLALALGGETEKMHQGHRGANHPVKHLASGRVEITSQNHGFVVKEKSLPANVEVTHRSLFDGSVEGIALKGKPVFSVQYHPESSPGPHDSMYLFEQFIGMLQKGARLAKA